MTATTPTPSADNPVDFMVRMTPAQLTEIHRRADLGPFDGRARSEYLVGCIFGEPHDTLLKRVHEIRDTQRARLRAQIEADRAKRAQRDTQGPDVNGAQTLG
jgi:hypothetical protein